MTDPGSSYLVRASYLLAREFGWTPQQVQEMTMAQVSIYIRMLQEETGRNKHEF